MEIEAKYTASETLFATLLGLCALGEYALGSAEEQSLIDHYMDLLQAKGDCFENLIKAVYKNKTNYLLFINRLNTVENKFNTALKPHLPDTIDSANSIVAAMETYSTKWRRNQAESIFSGKA